LIPQTAILERFVNSGSREHDKRCGKESFLHRGHGNALGCGKMAEEDTQRNVAARSVCVNVKIQGMEV
jgi:hypothetical protein